MSLDCIQSLLGQLWHSQCTILLRATRGQWCKASHEEVQTWERHQVHSNLAQVAIQLARETQAAGDTAHGSRHQMVQVTISWGSQLQSAEANIVQCFIVQQERLIRVLHQLMETQDCLGMGLALPNETRKCWECRKVTVWLCLKHIILIQDALYGSTTVSDTFGEGITEKVSIMPQLFCSKFMKNVCKACLEVEFGEGNRKELREHLQNILRVRCGLDIPHALWRSAMCPFQRRCRHRENGKAGSPADLTCWVVKPERATAFFTLTVFYSTYFRILEKKRSLKQLFGKMAVTTILFKTSISRIPLLLFGQHQVPSQLTQHLRCSDPDRFFN